MSSPVWREGPSWYVDKNKWPVQPDELASLVEYSEYLTDRDKKQKAYLEELEAMRAAAAPAPHDQANVVSSTPCSPARTRNYDEPLTDILFRDKVSWEKVVVSYTAVLRWQARIKSEPVSHAVARVQTRSSTCREREALLKQEAQMIQLPEKRTRRLAVTAIEYYNAEVKLLRLMQKQYAPQMFETLQKNVGMISEGLTWCLKLELIVSRSRHAATQQERLQGFGKDLIFIPLTYTHNGHKYLNRVAELLMINAHEQSGHAAAKGTLATFRIRFWVSKGTALAKWAKKRCPSCLKMDARVVTAPPAPLPAYRSHQQQPFQAVGMDFLGPLQRLQDTNEKIVCTSTYLCIHTCRYSTTDPCGVRTGVRDCF
jgi:hypothetical protein